MALVLAPLSFAAPTYVYHSPESQEEIAPAVFVSRTNAAGAKTSIWIDATSKFEEWDRVLLEFYDWDGDGKNDWIRITDYKNSQRDSDKKLYRYGAEVIEFYRGPQELKKMLSQYGRFLSDYELLKDRKIAENEVGTTDYSGGELKFKPFHSWNDAKEVRAIFELGDALTQATKDGGKVKEDFGEQILDLMKKPVLDYPADWRKFDK